MATPTKRELLELLQRVRMDLTAAQGKLTEIKRGVAALPDAPDSADFECGHCGLSFRSCDRMLEHVRNVHVGWRGEPDLSVSAKAQAGPRPEVEEIPNAVQLLPDRPTTPAA